MKEKLMNTIHGLKKINLLLVVFLAFGVKNLFIAPNFASAAILAVLGAVYAGARFIALKEPQKAPNRLKTELDKVQADVKEIKGALTKGNVAKISSKEKTRYF